MNKKEYIPVPEFDKKIVTVKNPKCKKCGKPTFVVSDFKDGTIILKRHTCEIDYKTFEAACQKHVKRKTGGNINQFTNSEILRLWLFLRGFKKSHTRIANQWALDIVMKDLVK
jgi:hypothetical protein